MENKEIYIDGVDVSEWTDEEIRYNFEKHSPKAIRQIAFDLYKQLKRKEQECETLASQLDFEAQKKECLEQECERLKHDNEYEVGALEGTIDNLKKEIDKLKTENEKLEQTLTEIKEIAKQKIDSKEFMIVQCMLNGNVDDKNKVLKQILQKISECEGKDEQNR